MQLALANTEMVYMFPPQNSIAGPNGIQFSLGCGNYVITVFYTRRHRSAKTLKPLTGEVNNIDYIVTMAPVKRRDILSSK